MLRACKHVGLKTRYPSDPWFRSLNIRTCVRPPRSPQPTGNSLRAHSTSVDVVVVGGGHAGTLVYIDLHGHPTNNCSRYVLKNLLWHDFMLHGRL